MTTNRSIAGLDHEFKPQAAAAYIDRLRANVPAELLDPRQWLLWKLVPVPNKPKPTKKPYNPHTGELAESNNPATWGTFDEAAAAYMAGRYSGLGFVFSDSDSYCGVDFDDDGDGNPAINADGTLRPDVARWVDLLDSYTERSQSGKGIHVIVRGKLPEDGRKSKKHGVEMYDTVRFFAMTGDVWGDRPAPIRDRQAQLEAMHAAVFGKKTAQKKTTAAPSQPAAAPADDDALWGKMFASSHGQEIRGLYDGDLSAHSNDASAADLALCNHLAFWTGKDAGRMDRMFRQTRLFRDKWDRNARRGETYGAGTIARAIAGTAEIYTNGNGPAASTVAATTAAAAQAQPLAVTLNNLRTDDEGHADAVRLLYPMRFVFVPEWGWLAWTGTHYSRDGGEYALRLAVVDTLIKRLQAADELLRNPATQALAEKVRGACKPNTGRVKAVVTALEAHLVTMTGEFDAHPYLLNTASGVVDLRTKKITPHDPAQRFTYCLDVPYDPDADDGEWRAYLLESIAGGADVIDVVQTSMGYWATGETAEEKIWYLWGATRSGKGTTMETIQAVLGPKLFGTAQFNTFTKDRAGDDQGFDLAGFHAARVVFAEESNRADYLNPGRVKAWTGGGSITCSFKHKDQFTYTVRWKGVLASNHALKTDAMDDAVWNRVQIWHYPLSHEGHEDLMLKEHMRRPDYLRGVLRFLVDGAARWYQLRPHGGIASITPDSMSAHKAQRREELDLVGRWIDENCAVGPALWTTSETLYRDFAEFCKDNGQRAYSKVEWGKLLNARGYEKVRKMSGGRQKNGYHGMGLLADTDTDADAPKD